MVDSNQMKNISFMRMSMLTIGTDSEFFVDNFSPYGGAGKLGADGCARVSELRTDPSVNVLHQVLQIMEIIPWMNSNEKHFATPIVSNHPLGGHIHTECKPSLTGEVSDLIYNQMLGPVRKYWELYGILSQMKTREERYGGQRDVRPQEWSPKQLTPPKQKKDKTLIGKKLTQLEKDYLEIQNHRCAYHEMLGREAGIKMMGEQEKGLYIRNGAYEFRQYPTGLHSPELFSYQLLSARIASHACCVMRDRKLREQRIKDWLMRSRFEKQFERVVKTSPVQEDFRFNWPVLIARHKRSTEAECEKKRFDYRSIIQRGLHYWLTYLSRMRKEKKRFILTVCKDIKDNLPISYKGHILSEQWKLKFVNKIDAKTLEELYV